MNEQTRMFALGAMCGVIVGMIVGYVIHEPHQQTSVRTFSEAVPKPADSTAELDHVALYKTQSGFSVCSRTELHACNLFYTSLVTGHRDTVRIGPVNIGSISSCDDIAMNASNRCQDAGADFFRAYAAGRHQPDDSWVRCVAEFGYIYQGASNTSILDPRDQDPSWRPGRTELACAEGHMEGRFSDEN